MNLHADYWECVPDQQQFMKVVCIISFPPLFW